MIVYLVIKKSPERKLSQRLLLFLSFSAVFKERHFDIPKLFGKVNVISVGVFEALYLVPECVYFRLAVVLNIRDVRRFVNTLAVLEYRNKKLTKGVICKLLFLPCFDRVEDFKGF